MIKRTSSEDGDFQGLVHLLDKDLALKDGDEYSFYAGFNGIDSIRHVVLYYEGGQAVGCGAFKEFGAQVVEIKRMFVRPDFRGRRIAAGILGELEKWAAELGYAEYVLETGRNNPQALHLYQREGYAIIPNYGQYEGMENSVCMKKVVAEG